MAYKKYIKRGGKIYGPYIYHSKRVNGKVISEYRGTEKTPSFNINTKKFNFIWVVLFLAIVLIGVFYVSYKQGGITGYSILNIDTDYRAGEVLQGKVSIALKNGELIPEDSNLIFDTSSGSYEYSLKDLISEETVEGNYFIRGSNVSGFGMGYGISGKKEIYPEVSFVLLLNSFLENTSSISETEVSGVVSKDKQFTYNLFENETVELKLKSVKTNISDLNDDEVEISVEDYIVTVTTGYSEFEEGFGEDYVGEDIKEIVIDVFDLGIYADEGDLKVSLNYNGEDLVFLNTVLNNSEALSDENVEVVPVSEEESSVNIPLSNLELSSEERAILENKFGDLSLEVKEAVLKNGFLTVRYELGDYWIEFTYEENIDDATLDVLMQQDRIKWLKDLSKRISNNEDNSGQSVSELEGKSFGV